MILCERVHFEAGKWEPYGLEELLNKIDRDGGTIMFVTPAVLSEDEVVYTVIWRAVDTPIRERELEF